MKKSKKKSKTPKRETYTTSVFSTGHLTEQDAWILERLGLDKRSGIQDVEFGWMIFCAYDAEFMKIFISELKSAGLSDQVCQIVMESNEAGHRWVNFDRDGEEYEDLQSYDW